MRPIELTFTGLRSYRGETTIDFTSLELFAVIGDTGAGKSTIIEALSLALYGEKTWKGGKLEHLIADGATVMSARFRFAVGGSVWTVTRSRRRGPGAGVNKLECDNPSAKFDGDADVTSQVEALLGLDHTQFLRAVVMPQGRFDELLRAKSADRTKILSSIFGLDDLVTVRTRAEALRAAWKDKLANAAGRRADLPTDPEGELAAARRRAEERTATAAQLRAASEAAHRHTEEVAGLERVTERLAKALDDLPSQTDDPVTSLRQIAARANDLAAGRRAAEAERADADTTVRQLEIDRRAVLDGFARRDDAVAAATTLRHAAPLLEAALADLVTAEADVTRLAGLAPVEAVPTELLDHAEQTARAQEAALERVEAARQARTTAQMLWADLGRVRTDLGRATTAVTTAEADLEASRQAAALATEALTAAATALDAVKVAHSDAVRRDRAAAAAQGCQAGDACPVCRRSLPDGFVPPASEGLAEVERRVDEADDAHRAAQLTSTQADAATRTAATTLAAARDARTAAEHLLRTAEQAAVAAGLRIDATDEPGALRPLDDAVDAAAAEAQRAVAAARAAQDAFTRATADIESARRLHRQQSDAAGAAETAVRRRIAEERARTADLPPSWRPTPDHSPAELLELADRIDHACTRLDELDEASRLAVRTLEAAGTTLVRLEADWATEVTGPTDATIGALRARHDRVAEVAAGLTNTAGGGELLPPLPDPPARSTDPAEAADLTAAVLAAHDAVLVEAARRLDELRVRLAAAVTERDGVLAGTGFDSLATLDQATGSAEAEARAAAVDVDRANGAVERAGRLDAFLAVARPFVANADLLATSLRDVKFINYLVSLREAELTAEATRRLKTITNDRYGFVDGFGVIDLASGEVRTPDSLSGGERFQAALALALGLVEIASRGGGRLDAVFVDEGFGSLDAGALDIALETLGAVARGGKMVALISHLRPVADYVDTVLHVRKDDVFGSRITVLRGEERERFLDDEIRAGLTG